MNNTSDVGDYLFATVTENGLGTGLNVTRSAATSATNSFAIWTKYLNIYGMPIIIIIGLIGNSVALGILLCSHLRIHSPSVYLAFLNASDNLFLLCLGLGVWLGWIRVYLIHKDGWCQIIVYLTYVSSFLSTWIVVCFTVERFIVVFYPLKRHVYCTRTRALRVAIAVTIFAFIAYSFSLATTKIHVIRSTRICMRRPSLEGLLRLLSITDSIITLAIPSVVIVFLNLAITFKIWHFAMRWKRSLADNCTCKERPLKTDSSSSSSSHKSDSKRCFPDSEDKAGTDRLNLSEMNSASSTLKSRFKHERSCRVRTLSDSGRRNIQLRTTRYLVIVSSVFVALNLPSHALRLHVFVAGLRNDSPEFSPAMRFWQQVFQLLSYMNFSVNIFLYCACSRQFRSAFLRAAQRCLRRLGEARHKAKGCHASRCCGKILSKTEI